MRGLGATVCAVALGLAGPACAQSFFNLGGDSFAAPVTSLRDMPFRTVVRQQYDYSCGSAALATILREHLGRPVGEAEIFRAMYAVGDQAKIRRVGFSLLDMKTYLASQGVQADGYRKTPADLVGLPGPAIALIKVGPYRHFVVIKGVRDGKVLIGDPNRGLRVLTLADFAAVWNGVIFLPRPAPGQAIAYNRAEEWKALETGAPEVFGERSVASFTRSLPPLYQLRLGGAQ